MHQSPQRSQGSRFFSKPGKPLQQKEKRPASVRMYAFATPSPLLRRVVKTKAVTKRLRTLMTLPERRVLVPIGNGSEEIEAASIVDTLRRAGASVTVASVEPSLTVKMSRGMKYEADASIADVAGPFDAIALPGGMPGAERLRDSEKLTELLKAAKGDRNIIAAVCASPAVVLATHGLLEGDATCYPADAFRGVVKNLGAGDVVVGDDGKLITGTGPGTALKWSLMIVEKLYGPEMADKLGKEMLAARD